MCVDVRRRASSQLIMRYILRFGAVEQARTAGPLPYQGSALPTELQQRTKNREQPDTLTILLSFKVKVNIKELVQKAYFPLNSLHCVVYTLCGFTQFRSNLFIGFSLHHSGENSLFQRTEFRSGLIL